MKSLQKTIKVRPAVMLLLIVAFVVTLGKTSRVGQAAGDSGTLLPKETAGEVEILYPTGGETWVAGTYETIRWAADDDFCAVLDYTKDKLSWEPIPHTTCVRTGNLGWEIPESLAGQTIQIRVSDYGSYNQDISGPIEILAGEIGIEMLYPTGVETWVAGTSRTIRWAGDDKICAVLNYTEDEGYSWEEITSHCIKSDDPEWGDFAWTIPGELAGKTIRIKIYDDLEPDASVSSGPIKVEASGCSVSIMPLGDCITWGNGSEKGDGYRRFLSASLTEQGYIVDFVGSRSGPRDADFDNDHEGHTGETTDHYTYSPGGKQSRLTGYLEENPPDIVLLHIGTMDIAYGDEVEEIAERIDDMLTDIYNYDQEIMVVLARIVTSLDTDSAGKTETLNKKIQEVADKRRVNGDRILVVDMEEALIPEDPNDPKDMYFSDDMHPNDAGYEKMARAWLDVLAPYLSEYCDECELPENPIGSTGETTYFSTCWKETEPNDSFDTADHFAYVYGEQAIRGEINTWDDVDFFQLDATEAVNLLLDLDAQIAGSGLDAVMCLYDHERTLIACNDDADGLDPMLFLYNFDWPEDSYYVKIEPFDAENFFYSGGSYTLSVDDPQLASPQSGGWIGSVPYSSADILAHTRIGFNSSDTPYQEKWILFFDASDVGITKNTTAFDTLFTRPPDGLALALTFVGKQTITDATGSTWKTTRHDVARFDAEQLGPSTKGEFAPQLIVDGSKVGLTTSAEEIDAITYHRGDLLVSTAGSAVVPDASGSGDVRARDEDLIKVDLIDGVAQPAWSMWFDGSSEIPGLAKEDLYAVSYDFTHTGFTWLELMIRDSGRVNGYPLTQKDAYLWYFDYWEYQEPGYTYPFEVDALD